jgi:uncharacterized protein
LRVEVVYALAHVQERVALQLREGALALHAIEASGVVARHPELASQGWRIGIAGKAVAPERPLREGDRVEILRPLAKDPKEARRQRARRTRV